MAGESEQLGWWPSGRGPTLPSQPYQEPWASAFTALQERVETLEREVARLRGPQEPTPLDGSEA